MVDTRSLCPAKPGAWPADLFQTLGAVIYFTRPYLLHTVLCLSIPRSPANCSLPDHHPNLHYSCTWTLIREKEKKMFTGRIPCTSRVSFIISYQERDGWVIDINTYRVYNKVLELFVVCPIDLHRVLVFVYRSISTGLLPRTLQLVLYTTPRTYYCLYFAFRWVEWETSMIIQMLIHPPQIIV